MCLPALHLPGKSVAFIDALFIATSAVCVTGLASIDIGSTFTTAGLAVILLLIQLGGLGITTYTSLVYVLWRNRVPFSDRLAVSQALLNKDVFDLPSFVRQVVGLVLAFEGVAALLLYLYRPDIFDPFNAVFHAVSAFCNAGFSPFPNNLMDFRDDVTVNSIIALSIIAGGLGFAVLREMLGAARYRCTLLWRFVSGYREPEGSQRYLYPGSDDDSDHRRRATAGQVEDTHYPDEMLLPPGARSQALERSHRLDRYSRMVLKTSAALVVCGAVLIFLMELPRVPTDSLVTGTVESAGGMLEKEVVPGTVAPQHMSIKTEGGPGSGLSLLLAAFFQSVSARTAGFNTVDLSTLSHAALLVLVGLMFVGGAPGSCAGGIKITTFRVLAAFFRAQFRGERQTVLAERAVPDDAVRRALTLFFFATLTVTVSVVLLSLTEDSLGRHAGDVAIFDEGNAGRAPLMPLLFEVVSALGTVGLSMNLTPLLSDMGKIIIIINMFVGRVGFITLVAAMQSLRPVRSYEYPAVDVPIG